MLLKDNKQEKIPKIVHYCWFGRGEKNDLMKMCIDSWKIHCREYRFIEWNEDNFDININKYVSEAYECKKYAFVSDYARCFAIYKYGGVI
ncbi:MAG: glycosyltransferase family 32 protein [Sarcina sp.]